MSQLEQWINDVKDLGIVGARRLWQFDCGQGWTNCSIEGPLFNEGTKYRRKNVTPTKPVDMQGGLDKRFDLEQAIMVVWGTADDLRLPNVSRNSIVELLEARCEALWAAFEDSIKNGR